MLTLTQQEFTRLPQQLLLELLLSVALCLLGAQGRGLPSSTCTASVAPLLALTISPWFDPLPVDSLSACVLVPSRRLPGVWQHEADCAQQRRAVSVTAADPAALMYQLLLVVLLIWYLSLAAEQRLHGDGCGSGVAGCGNGQACTVAACV